MIVFFVFSQKQSLLFEHHLAHWWLSWIGGKALWQKGAENMAEVMEKEMVSSLLLLLPATDGDSNEQQQSEEENQGFSFLSRSVFFYIWKLLIQDL